MSTSPQIVEEPTEITQTSDQAIQKGVLPDERVAGELPNGECWWPLSSVLVANGSYTHYFAPNGKDKLTAEYVVQSGDVLNTDRDGHPYVADFLNKAHSKRKWNHPQEQLSPEQAHKYDRQLADVHSALMLQANRVNDYRDFIRTNTDPYIEADTGASIEADTGAKKRKLSE